MSLPVITLKRLNHRGGDQIGLYFGYDVGLIAEVKKLNDARWSASNRCWYVENSSDNLRSIFSVLKDNVWIDKEDFFNIGQRIEAPGKRSVRIKPRYKKLIPEEYTKLLVRLRYSENTKKIYTSYFREFINHFPDLSIGELTDEHIRKFQDYLINDKKVATNTQNQAINAIKFYYEKVLGGEKKYYPIDRPRKDYILPDILSKEEVAKMIKMTRNPKHKCLLAVIYSGGLRRSEAINLKTVDIDSDRMLIKVRGGKGRKDRYVQLAKSTLSLLDEYYLREKPVVWVFEGRERRQYSATSVVNVVKAAARRAGVTKRVYPHILRHSIATHQIEQGINLRYIQEWLGHASSKTTERYTHVAENNFKNIKNPIDDFNI